MFTTYNNTISFKKTTSHNQHLRLLITTNIRPLYQTKPIELLICFFFSIIVPHNTQILYVFSIIKHATYFYSNKDLKKNDQSNTERILMNRYITIQALFFYIS
ncbi:hypothetical protein FDZ66_03785 [Ehrlichia ruminantium]|nr:hypothetical protein FDZ68_03785 [Ehrlichia ruminantium]QLK51678.1 hypothetical protein FDZ66_03785 [Ehrlichia ruminantium]QLK53516.1 hypothetical protein FDZ64_03780 [Ehrlichia ruminantium]